MAVYADLHLHSSYSRACSRDANLRQLAWWAARKGLGIIGTGDFQHPAWRAELTSTLVPAEPGLYRLRPDVEDEVLRRLPVSCRTPTRFALSTEISTIYKSGDRTRKVHHLLYAPSLEAAGTITAALDRVGNIAADGRPILGLDSRDLLEITLSAGDGCYLVPAHIWTPWFAALGSRSGFDRVDDCYGDLAGEVFAVETGLSSDPPMNWRVSSLDRFRLVSNSDAHSPPILGREATVFAGSVESGTDYFAILRALRGGPGFAGTVNFFPEEGRYHLDGHRNCDLRWEPARTREAGGTCPSCGKQLTIGVLHRVEELADRPDGYRPPDADPYRSLVQLPQVVGETLRVGPKSKAVGAAVSALVEDLGPELTILEHTPLDAIAAAGGQLLAEAVGRSRRGEVRRDPGYDGEYGTVRLFEPAELRTLLSQGTALFDLAPAAPATARAARDPAPVAAPAEPAPPAPRPAPNGGLPRTAPPPVAVSGLLAGLDPDQRAAAAHGAGPLLIVAGPGTGKTRTLTHLIAHRVDGGLDPRRVLAVTFTRRACEELRERLHALTPARAGGVLVSTFHGLGLRIVREQADRLGLPAEVRIADEATLAALLRDELGMGSGHLKRFVGGLSAAKRARALGVPGEVAPEVAALLPRYDAELRRRGLVDLDDLLTLPVELLRADPALAETYSERWPLVCVDEYQDVDPVQYALLRLLTRPDGDVVAIGDPDQAIYGFRGSDVAHFLAFGTDFPGAREVTLSRNYRSTRTIVRGALRAIARTTLVPDRELEAVSPLPDGPIAIHAARDEQDEAAVVADTVERLLGGTSFGAIDAGEADSSTDARLSFADIAVLYRTDRQAMPVLEALTRKGYPVQKRSHERLAARPGVREIADVLRGQAGAGAVTARLKRAVQTAVDAGGVDVDQVRLAAELLAPLAAGCGADAERFLTELALGAEVDTWDPRADRISLLTLHAAKGLEFPVVVIVGCEDGLLPLRWGPPSAAASAAAAAAADEAEERRLFFVGMTRATTRLLLTRSARRTRSGEVVERSVSPFVTDIGADLLDHRSLSERPRSRAGAVQLRLV